MRNAAFPVAKTLDELDRTACSIPGPTLDYLALLAAIAVTCVALLGRLVCVLRRDCGLIWRHGDPLPDVPADAPVGWQRTA